MIPIALGLILKAATVVRAVQAISSALRPAPKPPVSESVPRSENVLCGRFGHSLDKYRYCGNSPINWSDSKGLLPEGEDAYPIGNRPLVDINAVWETLEKRPDSLLTLTFDSQDELEFDSTITVTLIRTATGAPVDCGELRPDPITKKITIRPRTLQWGKPQKVIIDFQAPKLRGTTWLIEIDIRGKSTLSLGQILTRAPPLEYRFYRLKTLVVTY